MELKTLNNRGMVHILQRHLPAEVSEAFFELFSSGPEAGIADSPPAVCLSMQAQTETKEILNSSKQVGFCCFCLFVFTMKVTKYWN